MVLVDAHKGSNLGPLPCEGNALPLSYASGIFVHDQRPVNQRPIGRTTPSEPAIYEVQSPGVKLTGVKLSRQTAGPNAQRHLSHGERSDCAAIRVRGPGQR